MMKKYAPTIIGSVGTGLGGIAILFAIPMLSAPGVPKIAMVVITAALVILTFLVRRLVREVSTQAHGWDIPNLIGKYIDDVEDILGDYHVLMRRKDQHSKNVPKDVVISQDTFTFIAVSVPECDLIGRIKCVKVIVSLGPEESS